jgi:hypothetical protein
MTALHLKDYKIEQAVLFHVIRTNGAYSIAVADSRTVHLLQSIGSIAQIIGQRRRGGFQVFVLPCFLCLGTH